MSISDIARRLKNARLDAGLTQREAADKLGITYQAISNYERGINGVDIHTLSRLCAAYGIKVVDFLTSPYWDESMLRAYKNAKSDAERDYYIGLWGRPKELLEVENERREPDLNPLEPKDEQLLYIVHQLPDPEIAYRLVRFLPGLNKDGHQKILDYASDLSSSEKYNRIIDR